MNGAVLHSLAEELSQAFTSEVFIMTKSERIVELAGAQWVGVSPEARSATKHVPTQVMFRDPLTGSTCSLPEDGLTIAGVRAKLEAKRELFGRKP